MKPPRNAPRKTPEQSSSRTVRGATPTRSPFELAVAQLTTGFVEAVIAAIANASLDDLVEGDVAQRRYTRNDLVTVDEAETPSRRQGESNRLTSSRPSTRANASSESNGAGSIAPPSGIEDITNPDVLLAMLGGGGKEAPAAPKSLPKILMTPTSSPAQSGSTQAGHAHGSHAHGSHGHGGQGQGGQGQTGTSGATDTKTEEAAAAPASAEAPPTSRAVSSGPRLRPGEEILRASAGGGAVIRRRRV